MFKQGQKRFKSSGLGKWTAAVQRARKELGVTGFMVGGILLYLSTLI